MIVILDGGSNMTAIRDDDAIPASYDVITSQFVAY